MSNNHNNNSIMNHEDDFNDDFILKQIERDAARLRRNFTYKLRKVKENDTTLTTLSHNIHCMLSGSEIIPLLLKALRTNTVISTITIDNCYMMGIGGFGLLLTNNNHAALQHLTLRGCWIPTGASNVFHSLTTNTSLVTLNLSRNFSLFQDTQVAKTLEQTLPNMTCLQNLVLSDTRMPGPAITCIFRGLQSTTCSIKSLDISHNHDIGYDLATSLAQYPVPNLERLGVELTNVSQFLDQNPQLLAAIAKNVKDHKLWKLDYLVLHRIEHYKTNQERQLQYQCWQHVQNIEYHKHCNAIHLGGILTLEQPALWPHVLQKTQENPKFNHDLLFHLVREKSTTIFCNNQSDNISTTTPEKSTLIAPHPPASTSTTTASSSLSGSPPSRRKKQNNVKNGAIRQRRSRKINFRDKQCSRGFTCRIHQGPSRLLPRYCCTFERFLSVNTIQPNNIDKYK